MNANAENTNKLKRHFLSAQVDLSKFSQADFNPATADEKKQQDVMGESTTFFKDGMRRLRKNPLAMGSIIVLTLIILTIIIAPHIVPYRYDQIITVNGKRDKSAANMGFFEYSKLEQQYMDTTGVKLFPHIFGTDSLGRDYFIRVIYCGGVVDLVMMRIVDIIYSLPDMLLIILISVVLDGVLSNALVGTVFSKLGSNMISMFIVFALLYWVSMARLIRGQVLSIKNNEYVLAAKCIGTPNHKIIKKHIIPNCLSVIIITTALQIPSAIFTESYLSFLGLGVSAPLSSLGSLANAARSGMQSYPSKLVIPAVAICLIVLALNLLGDGLRDAFDSKLK